MAATFCTVAYLAKPDGRAGGVILTGRFAPAVTMFRGLPSDLTIEVRTAEKRADRSPDYRVVAVNGREAEVGVLWKSRAGQSSMANGKVDGTVGLLLGIPAGGRLLVQAAGDGDPDGTDYRLTIVIDDVSSAASQARDFGDDDDDDPFA